MTDITYPTTAINRVRAKDGKVYPKSPAGIAVPVGWRLSDGGSNYIRDDNEWYRLIETNLGQLPEWN